MRNVVLAILGIAIFSGCGSDGGSSSENESSKVSENETVSKVRSTKNSKYWGEWKNIKTENTLYITSKESLTITEIDENIIKIDSNYYLRAGARNVKLAGKLYDDGTGRKTKGYESIGGIDIILQNILDENIEANITAKDDGSFSDNTLPTGDYNLTVQDDSREVETVVSLVRENEDIGTFKLVPKGIANFKASFKSDTQILYADGNEFSGEVIVENIGKAIGEGLNFTISLQNAKTFQDDTVLGSIPVNGKKRIPVRFSFNPQYENVKNYKLAIGIRDSQNRKWSETVEIPVSKGSFSLSIKSQKSLNGMLTDPDGKVFQIKTSDKIINLPLISPDDSYSLIITNYGNSLNDETIYGLSLNSDIKSFENFRETSAFEPNDNIDSATPLKVGDSIISYWNVNDIDYFKIETEEDLTSNISEMAKLEASEILEKDRVAENIIIWNDKYISNLENSSVVTFAEAEKLALPKGEFETDAEVETRRFENRNQIISSWLGTQNISMEYDADSESFTVSANYGIQFNISVSREKAQGFKESVKSFDLLFEKRDGKIVLIGAETQFNGESFESDFRIDDVEEVRKEILSKTVRVGKLMFQDFDLPSYMNWDSAVKYCQDLKIKFSVRTVLDWRLPTKDELLVAYQNKEAFRNLKDDKNKENYFWSLTEKGSEAFRINFISGDQNYRSKSTDKFVICVR